MQNGFYLIEASLRTLGVAIFCMQIDALIYKKYFHIFLAFFLQSGKIFQFC